MARTIVIDAGPLVALLNSGDQFHPWAQTTFASLEPRFSTCEAIVSETAHLLPKNRATLSRFRRVLEKGIVTPEPLGPLELPAIFDLMEKYADVPMSFAAACLVRMIERTPGSTLFTTDADFKFYRQHRRRLIPLIAPF